MHREQTNVPVCDCTPPVYRNESAGNYLTRFIENLIEHNFRSLFDAVTEKVASIVEPASATVHPDRLEEHCTEDCAAEVAEMIHDLVDWQSVVGWHVRRRVERIKRELGSDYEPQPTGDEWKEER